jgi:hypothetical protein
VFVGTWAVNELGATPHQLGGAYGHQPVLVTLFQLRMSRWAARYARGPKFATRCC